MKQLAVWVLLGSSMVAHGADWRLGMGAGAAQSWYRGESVRASALPLLNYQGEHFYVEGASLGWRQPLGNRLTLAAKAEWEFDQFDGKDNDLYALRQLDKRKSGLLACGQLSVALGQRHTLSLGVMQDTGSRHRATLGTFSYELRLGDADSRSQWSLNTSTTYLPQRYQQYYTGVSAAEAARSGLPAYQAESALRREVGLSWRYGISRDLSVMAKASVTHLPSDVKWQADTGKGSPLIERNTIAGGLLGLSYGF